MSRRARRCHCTQYDADIAALYADPIPSDIHEPADR
ncbi:hypothetical protein QFZ66_007279 [Streptomyces sp. B4I13]|nr:hypothetical protein [Streptomyces sp. B4I13]